MKRLLVAALAVLFVASLGALLAAEGKEGTWHGIITDDGCGKKHMEKTPEEAKKCTLSCVEKGAMLALYDPKADALFALSDQAKAKEFAGEHVMVKGMMSADGKSITVAEIQKGAGMKEGKK